MATYPNMLIHGKLSVLTFNQTESNDLIRYFKQLKKLFTWSNVMANADKKEYATSYIKAKVAEYWEVIPQVHQCSEHL